MSLLDILEDFFNESTQIFLAHEQELKLLVLEFWKFGQEINEEINQLVVKTQCWLPEVLRKRTLSNEIKQIDYEAASYILLSIFVNHFMTKLVYNGSLYLDHKENRIRLFTNIVNTWKGNN